MDILADAAGLAYSTPDGRSLVRDLSFQVRGGEILAITGPNGTGKSTLLNVLLGLAPATTGQAGIRIPSRQVGHLSQLHNREFHIPLRLTDVLAFAVRGRLDVDKALSFGLLERRHLALGWNTASGGERQKTLLTQVLLAAPRLLVLDEPMNHLDVPGRRQLRQALETFVRRPDHAVVMVCHEKSLAADGWRSVTTLNLREHAAV